VLDELGECGGAVRGRDVRVCMLLQEVLDRDESLLSGDGRVTMRGPPEYRSLAVVLGVDIGLLADEKLDDINLASRGSVAEGCATLVVGFINPELGISGFVRIQGREIRDTTQSRGVVDCRHCSVLICLDIEMEEEYMCVISTNR
jgi:hypothetical protein